VSVVQEQPQDGNLPAARRRLEAAVWALVEPRTQWIEGKARHAPCLYLQLRDAVPGEQGNTRGQPRSVVPFWPDAMSLLDQIDTRIGIEQPMFKGVPPTVGRLRLIVARKWRPQDTRKVDQIADVIEQWVKEIDGLLNPEPSVYLYAAPPAIGAAACTACQTDYVWKPDPGDNGRPKRQPALKVTKDGCRCQKCHASWEPGQLRMLAAALGYPLPAGVLE
jgi:hypothetical protein